MTDSAEGERSGKASASGTGGQAQLGLRIVAVGLAYFLSARLGLSMAFGADQVTAVWPPTGIALAAVLLAGWRIWPGIFAGALLANLLENEPFLTALGIGAGNTLEALTGAWLLTRFSDFDKTFSRQKDILALVALPALISTALAATIGVISLCSAGVQPWDKFAPLWFLWWLGDGTGAVIMAPLLLVWIARPLELSVAPRRAAGEAVLLLSALVLLSFAALKAALLPGIVIFPFVIWGALRFRQHGSTMVTVASAAIMIVTTLSGQGAFTGSTPDAQLLHLQMFMNVVAVTGLSLAIAISARATAEKRTLEGMAHVRNIIDHALDAIVSIDGEGRITEWNAQAEHLFGWPREETLGQDMAELLIPPAWRAAHRRGLQNCLAGGPPRILNTRMEMSALHRRGHTVPIDITVTAHKGEGGRAFTAFMQDISGKRQAHAAKSHLAAIVEFSDDAILAKALDGSITFWSRGAERMFGYGAYEAVGRHISLILPPERMTEETRILEQIRDGIPADHYETQRLHKNGRLITVSISVAPIRDEAGTVTGASTIIRNVSGRDRQ